MINLSIFIYIFREEIFNIVEVVDFFENYGKVWIFFLEKFIYVYKILFLILEGLETF